MTQRSFEVALKKGEIGEMIVRRKLEEKGWVVYQPVTDGAHCFDMLSIKDKRNAIALDVKSKARMNKWPATGIDQRHFNEYLSFSEKHNMPFWVVFVDEMQKTIYGNCIENLEQRRNVEGVMYPFVLTTRYGKKIRLWPLEAMIQIDVIRERDIASLIRYSQRSHEYEVTQ